MLNRRQVIGGASALASLPFFIPRVRGEGGALPDRVILMVIDGIRATEWANDSSATYGPRFHQYLKPRGSLFTRLVPTGETWTYPSHLSLIAGRHQVIPRTMELDEHHPDSPTIFEEIRLKRPELDGTKVRAVVGKFFFQGLGRSHHPSFGADLEAFVNHRRREGRMVDGLVFDEVHRVLDEERPEFLLINAGDVDEMGHVIEAAGSDDFYYNAIRRVDVHLHTLWDRLQWDPFYKDRTLFLLTTDHGRHDETGGPKGLATHGDSCTGCRTSFLYAWGPGVPEGVVSDVFMDQTAIAPAIAQVLGFAMHHAPSAPATDEIFGAGVVPPVPLVGFGGVAGTLISEESTEYVLSYDVLVRRDGTMVVVWAARTGKTWGIYARTYTSSLSEPGPVAVIVEGLTHAEHVRVVELDAHMQLIYGTFTSNNWYYFGSVSEDGVGWTAPDLLGLRMVDPIFTPPFNPWIAAPVVCQGRVVLPFITTAGFRGLARAPLTAGGAWECKYLEGRLESGTLVDLATAVNPANEEEVLVLAPWYQDAGREPGQSMNLDTYVGVLSGTYMADLNDVQRGSAINDDEANPRECRGPALVVDAGGTIHAGWSQLDEDGQWGVYAVEAELAEDVLDRSPERISGADESASSLQLSVAGATLFASYLVHRLGTAEVVYRKRASGLWSDPIYLSGDDFAADPKVAIFQSKPLVFWRVWRSGEWRLMAEVPE